MTDIFSIAKRSEIMSKVRSTNTQPELLVRKFLFSEGLRFRLHQKNLPGKPDIVLKKYRAIVLVNGCFWHGHANCKRGKSPKSKQDFWIPKIEQNRKRDRLNVLKLKKQGWRVFIIWECQLVASKRNSILSRLVDNIRK